jgi:serine/threonine-protein kinase
MAPEMATGEALDGRTDLYSLGCVAYFLLTGRLAVEGETGLQMLMRRLQDDPLPPSQRTELPVPAALDAVVLACLARRREDRPSGAADLRHRLDALGIPPWTDDEAAQWWARHRPAVAPAAPHASSPATALITRAIDD